MDTNAISALIKAQSDFKVIGFDRLNPHFKSKFASLTAIMEHIGPILSKNGLGISHHIITEAGSLSLRTRLLHSGGTTLETEVPLLMAKNDMQSLGSSVTYAKRYAISALLNLVTDEDDDGNEATKQAPPTAKQEAPKTINNPLGKSPAIPKASIIPSNIPAKTAPPKPDTSFNFGFTKEDDVP
jgi:hypothetical protein